MIENILIDEREDYFKLLIDETDKPTIMEKCSTIEKIYERIMFYNPKRIIIGNMTDISREDFFKYDKRQK